MLRYPYGDTRMTMTSIWNGAALDLEAYLAFIGYEGDRAPTLATLRALHRGHVLSVRWENLEAVLRKDVPLDLESLQAKLLGSPRGGYCFEHATLYAAALERIGFEFFAIQGRVQMGAEQIRPATHAMMVVELDGKRWLSDIGFGASPLEPIEFTDAADATDGAWTYRLRRGEVTPGAEGWTLCQPAPDGWMVRHTFTLDPQYPIDFRVANHFVATSSHSPFSTRIFVQRVRPDRLDTLDNRTLRTVRPGVPGPDEVRELEPSELIKVLADIFRIELSGPDADLLVSKLL